ncbi:uncharacterized protein B0I36DRAFT_314156 [Microdochium trichocladiopsis]|uniref:Secreted protein n=1 Tax=Microdochium trichocladiopsis TaxID=1682393 RepID=A0A9P8YEL2_9PEZI|nr:uncharacterized protein B0I36DRAFT_314156 [Microdochium trichocladiopsis]KAH7037477.1 hypothetical protein B0I36DRAFT_314156 [Microdochium trichocladiopsis]
MLGRRSPPCRVFMLLPLARRSLSLFTASRPILSLVVINAWRCISQRCHGVLALLTADTRPSPDSPKPTFTGPSITEKVMFVLERRSGWVSQSRQHLGSTCLTREHTCSATQPL